MQDFLFYIYKHNLIEIKGGRLTVVGVTPSDSGAAILHGENVHVLGRGAELVVLGGDIAIDAKARNAAV